MSYARSDAFMCPDTCSFKQYHLSRDWTTRDHIARVDIARPDNVAPEQTILCCMEYYMNFIYQFVLVFFVIFAYYCIPSQCFMMFFCQSKIITHEKL